MADRRVIREGLGKRLLLSGVALLGFGGILWLLLHRQTAPFDLFVSRLFSGLPSSVDLFFSILCRTGNAEVELPLLLFAAIHLTRRSPSGGDGARDRFFLILWFAVLVLGTLLEHLLKGSLPAFHPGREFDHDPLSGWEVFFPLHIHVHASFPSGHTFRALMIVLFIRKFFPRHLRISLLWAGGIMVGVIVLGWHFTSDVIGSSLLVLAFSPWFLSPLRPLRNIDQ
ncbi:MAG: phosphatase PAP2 family protein [Leptospirillia bacterium]